MKKNTVAGHPAFKAGGLVLMAALALLVAVQTRQLRALYEQRAEAGPGIRAHDPDDWARPANLQVPELPDDPALFTYEKPGVGAPFSRPFHQQPGFQPHAGTPNNPFDFMNTLNAELNLLIGEFGLNAQLEIGAMKMTTGTATRVTENEREYQVRMDVGADDLQKVVVEVSNQQLSVRGISLNYVERRGPDGSVTREQQEDPFQQSFPLPGPVNHHGILHDFKDGVLNITLPKSSAHYTPLRPRLNMA